MPTRGNWVVFQAVKPCQYVYFRNGEVKRQIATSIFLQGLLGGRAELYGYVFGSENWIGHGFDAIGMSNSSLRSVSHICL